MIESNKGQSQKISAFHIRQSYTNEKLKSDLVAHLWIYLVLRPISFVLTPIFINLGFNANSVTALGLILVLCALVFIVLGAVSQFYFVIGAVIINIWLLFDCIDGNIARFKGQSSKFGRLFDHIVGLIFYVFFPICLGLGLCLSNSEYSMLALKLNFPCWFWLLAGAVESTTGLFCKIVSLQFRKIVGGEQPADLRDANINIGTILPRAIISFQIPLFLIAALFGVLGLFLLGYALFNLISLITMSGLSLRKASLMD